MLLNETNQNILTIVIIVLGFIASGGGILAIAKYLRSNPDKANALENAIAGLTKSVPTETMEQISKLASDLADLAKVFAGLLDRKPGLELDSFTAVKASVDTSAKAEFDMALTIAASGITKEEFDKALAIVRAAKETPPSGFVAVNGINQEQFDAAFAAHKEQAAADKPEGKG